MSAHVYIQYSDVPDVLTASSAQHVEQATGAKLIAFHGCPQTGQLDQVGERLQIEFPFPRDRFLYGELIDWFVYWGIGFAVVP